MTKMIITKFCGLMLVPIFAFSALTNIELDENTSVEVDAMSNFRDKKDNTDKEANSIILSASYGEQVVYENDRDRLKDLNATADGTNGKNGLNGDGSDSNSTKNKKNNKLSYEEEMFNKYGQYARYAMANRPDKNLTLFYNETMLNWVRLANGSNIRGKAVTSPKTSMVVQVTADKSTDSKNEVNATQLVVVKGYCYITENIEVGIQPGALRTECQTNVGAITMFANLVNVNKQSSLVVDPKYIEKNGVRFEVKSSIVTNETKTSYNVATFVNDTKIAQVGWGALSAGSDEIKAASNEYLQAIEEAKTEEQTTLLTATSSDGSITSQPTTTTNTEDPDPLDYLLKAAINLTASAVKETAELYKKDLPYLYYIAADSKIWIDLKVNKQGEYVK